MGSIKIKNLKIKKKRSLHFKRKKKEKGKSFPCTFVATSSSIISLLSHWSSFHLLFIFKPSSSGFSHLVPLWVLPLHAFKWTHVSFIWFLIILSFHLHRSTLLIQLCSTWEQLFPEHSTFLVVAYLSYTYSLQFDK